MNASIKTLLITAALSGLLGGTPAIAQASTKNPFVVAAAEQSHTFDVGEATSINQQEETPPASYSASLLNPFVVAAAEQLRDNAFDETSMGQQDATPATHIASIVNPFVAAAAEQLHRDNTAGDTSLNQQACDALTQIVHC